MTQQVAVGVDIGGTKIAFALVDETGRALADHQLPTRPQEGEAAVLERVVQGVHELMHSAPAPVVGVGVGCPGVVDPAAGVVRQAVNLGWAQVSLRAELERRLRAHIPVHIQNDVKAAALGEHTFGAVRGQADFVYLALGTGLGGAVVAHGQVVTGAAGFATEVGHLSLDPEGRRCSCGRQGCVEMYVGGIGLLASLELYRDRYPSSALAQANEPTTASILSAAQASDPLALAILEEGGRALGWVLGMCVGILNPPLIVIGGGLGHAAWQWLMPPALRELRRRVLPQAADSTQIVPSAISVSAVGAASLVWHAPQRAC